MSNLHIYKAGTPVVLGATVDPGQDASSVALTYRLTPPGGPAGAPVTVMLGTGVWHIATGQYQYIVDTTGFDGLVDYEWIMTGTVVASAAGAFIVDRLPV